MKLPSSALAVTVYAALAASLAACGPSPALRRTALDCPQKQGALTRTSVSADGRACAYTDADGDEVSLKLIPVSGSPAATLTPIERQLQAMVSPPKPAERGAGDRDAGQRSDDRADINLPGVSIQASGDQSNVRVGSLHVDAANGGAVIRDARDTRLRGEQLSPERRGYRAAFIVAGSGLPDGLTTLGYVAGGPKVGPLTVAILKMKTHNGRVIHHDVSRLVRRNGGI